MNGTNTVRTLAALALLASTSTRLEGAPGVTNDERRPNIVLILADDMGYECVGANGGKSYRTPVLDRLARGGLRFEHCYSQPICTPSRVQIMTGIYNQRNYIRFGLLDPQATTFAQLLKRAGYKTCVAGKWQLLGGVDAPRHFGFDEYCLWQLTVRKSRYPNPVLERDGKVIAYTNGEYGPDVVSDFICDFIRRNKDGPFLAYYPMILPHWPFEPTPDSADWDPKAAGVLKGQGTKKYFADMVTYTDKCVGKIVRTLEELDLRSKTLVLFTGDNGTAVGIDSLMGTRVVPGGKGKTTDAGTHVPLIASWPGVVPAGRMSRDLVDFSDFLPTLVELAGADLPDTLEIDGRSFLPRLRGEKGRPREWTYCWYARNGGPTGRQFARNQRFKIYADGSFFDIESDWAEARPLDPSSLSAEAAAARNKLQPVLEGFRGTRKQVTSEPKPTPSREEQEKMAAARVKTLGGHVFSKEGRVVEVILNKTEVRGRDLRLLGSLASLTDLSLENTRVGDGAMVHLEKLEKLEWLNLYRTRVGDAGLGRLAKIRSLKLLPIGGTRVTDAGMKHVEGMVQLEYLGLRDNRVTDDGLEHVAKLVNLKGLHLGATAVTNAGLEHLRPLGKLEKLWLSSTSVSDEGIERIATLESLRELHVDGTKISDEGLKRLRAALPGCEVER